MLIMHGFCISMCFVAVFVVYVGVGWPCMVDYEIEHMDKPTTDHCGLNRWTFMPPLTELKAVHWLLIR